MIAAAINGGFAAISTALYAESGNLWSLGAAFFCGFLALVSVLEAV